MIHRISGGICAFVLCASILGGCGGTPAEGTRQSGADESVSGTQEAGGTVQKLNTTKGRYVEEQVELPEAGGFYNGLAGNGETLRLSSEYGMDMVSVDGGATFSPDETVPEAFISRAQTEYISAAAVSPQGQRITSFFYLSEDGQNGTYTVLLTQPDGKEKELAELTGDNPVSLFYGQDGYFYASNRNGSEHKLYRISAETGEISFLTTFEEEPGYIVVAGNRLYAALEGQMQIFDLEKNALAEDKVLTDFLKPYLAGYSYQDSYPFLICQGPDADSIYVTVREGVYHHAVGGAVMEQVIDGALCSISDISRYYVGMSVMSEGSQDIFYILYYNGELMRYTYDETVPTVPETVLRIYSLYEDSDIRLAVSAFQAEHPELYAKYEVGVADESGQTQEDALITLSTELAAGKGPDILIMDDIPYESYIDKGVLADMSNIVSGVDGAGLFENILNPFKRDEKIYTIPATFSVPVLCGKAEDISGIGTLKDLADRLEQVRAGRTQGGLIGFQTPLGALELLSMNASGTWIKEDGSLDRDAVTEFLTQSKRIYDTQMNGADMEDEEGIESSNLGISSGGQIKRVETVNITSTLSMVINYSQPFAAGNFSGTSGDLSFMTSLLQLEGMEYRLMPALGGKVFLPSSMLSVNNATAYKEQAEEFVKFAVSGKFQSDAKLSGVPINRDAFHAKQEYPYPNESPDTPYLGLTYEDETGKITSIDIYWAGKEAFAAFGELVESLDTSGKGVSMVRWTVLELGQAALTGEKGIEETVDDIEKNVQLYLAE